ncbi:MAG: riboflavin synthase [Nitrososphaerota archaeon]|nr:riboflavin synthase [Nitrososphaerota archaeon]
MPFPDVAQIAATRRRLGITQHKLAEESRVSQSLVSKIESGRIMPTYGNAKMIFDALERLEMESGGVGIMGASGPSKRHNLPLPDAIRHCTGRIGLVDTTFSRIDTASIAIKEIKRLASKVTIRRYTVPGIRDTPLACKLLIERQRCGVVLVTGMVSRKGIEKQIENQAVQGIIMVQLHTNKHVITAFFDEDEARDRRKLYGIVLDRVRKHSQNALKLLALPASLTDYAGFGIRQGVRDVGRFKV